jgi:hypothetical protein
MTAGRSFLQDRRLLPWPTSNPGRAPVDIGQSHLLPKAGDFGLSIFQPKKSWLPDHE